ncbi:MAG: branched-chain amino acid ABC transporter permease [Clostridiales bacterium]|nr:branched-chain amino acid ABC transporter permease [Clostridiales bacterium]
MLKRIYKNPYARFAFFGALLALLPLFTSAGLIKVSVLTTVASIFIYSIAALGLNLLLGYAGQISLGTAGFMGLGAYLAGYLAKDMPAAFWIGLLAAIIVPTLIGILVGFISLRIAGIYLAIATLCVSEILLKTFEEVEPFTGGMRGMNIKYPQIFGIQMDRTTMYWLLVGFLVLMMILTYNLVNGQFGRALHAMRGSESAAQAMGVNLLKYRLIVFALATAYAALAGALYVFFIRSSYPTTWSLMLSLNLVAAIVIGGMRSIYGTVVGAFVVWGLSDLVIKQLPVIRDLNGVAFIATGILIVVIIMFYPGGLRNIWYDVPRALRKLRAKVRPKTPQLEDEL